jgi:hypothetical protein
MSDTELQRLLDRGAIEELLVAYAVVLDGRHWERLHEIFTPSARVRYGKDWIQGPEAVAAYCRRVLERLDVSQHRVGTFDIQVAGDRATSSCYFAAEHVRTLEGGVARYTVAGTYRDVLERGAAGWRIAQRELLVSWTDGDPQALA